MDPNQIGLHESGAESSSDEFEVRRGGGGRGGQGRGMRGHLPGFTLLTLPLDSPDNDGNGDITDTTLLGKVFEVQKKSFHAISTISFNNSI